MWRKKFWNVEIVVTHRQYGMNVRFEQDNPWHFTAV